MRQRTVLDWFQLRGLTTATPAPAAHDPPASIIASAWMRFCGCNIVSSFVFSVLFFSSFFSFLFSFTPRFQKQNGQLYLSGVTSCYDINLNRIACSPAVLSSQGQQCTADKVYIMETCERGCWARRRVSWCRWPPCARIESLHRVDELVLRPVGGDHGAGLQSLTVLLDGRVSQVGVLSVRMIAPNAEVLDGAHRHAGLGGELGN